MADNENTENDILLSRTSAEEVITSQSTCRSTEKQQASSSNATCERTYAVSLGVKVFVPSIPELSHVAYPFL